MTEIRPIREREGDEFVELLCSVFGLELSRAKAIFYAEPMFDLQRKWALFEAGKIVSILTTVPLEFGWGTGYGIAGVATAADRRREGFAGRLLEKVNQEMDRRGEQIGLLLAKEQGLYRQIGFEALDTVVRGPILRTETTRFTRYLEFEEVKTTYEKWAAENPARLRRDDRRWRYWKWNLRLCAEQPSGYICFEGGTVREAIGVAKADVWDVPIATEWVGLRSMAELMGVPLESSVEEYILMGRNCPATPQIFMTDQF